MAQKWHMFGKLRVILPSIALAIGVIFGLVKGIDYVRYSMKHVTTDDARVKGRMVSVAPEVSGVVKVLRVDEGSVVKAGEVLLELTGFHHAPLVNPQDLDYPGDFRSD